MATILTLEQVLARSDALPSFPRVVMQVLQTLDDPDANLNALVTHIEHDPVIAGRVLSLANRAASAKGGRSAVTDIFTAISLIGLMRVRETVLLISLADFLKTMGRAGNGTPAHFWEHSVGVGVAALQLASHSQTPMGLDSALISGLLHDVGQLWLYRFEASLFDDSLQAAHARGVECDVTERERFGVDHGTIGSWLATDWGLPSDIANAVARHHAPDTAANEPLVAVVHVAEVLSHALNVTHSEHSRVTAISAASCETLGLCWGDDSQSLFGCIEARSRHALAMM